MHWETALPNIKTRPSLSRPIDMKTSWWNRPGMRWTFMHKFAQNSLVFAHLPVFKGTDAHRKLHHGVCPLSPPRLYEVGIIRSNYWKLSNERRTKVSSRSATTRQRSISSLLVVIPSNSVCMHRSTPSRRRLALSFKVSLCDECWRICF